MKLLNYVRKMLALKGVHISDYRFRFSLDGIIDLVFLS
jgi:hypothetical protein